MTEAQAHQLIATLRSDDVAMRRRALTEIEVELPDVPVDALLPLLLDADAAVRRLTVRLLEDLGDPRAVPGLIRATADDEPLVGRAAAVALSRFHTPHAVVPMLAGFDHPLAETRAVVIAALREMPDPRAADARWGRDQRAAAGGVHVGLYLIISIDFVI
jgi:HEAT repeat protein